MIIDTGTFKRYIKSIMNDMFTVPITKLRKNAASIISDVTTKGISAVVMQRSEPKVVIADYEYFKSLEESVMDTLDVEEAEKAKTEPTISLESYVKRRWGSTLK